MPQVFGNTVWVSHTGSARLSPDLVAAEYVRIKVDLRTRHVFLDPAESEQPDRLRLTWQRNGVSPTLSFRQALKKLGTTSFRAKGTYQATLSGNVVVIDMSQRVRWKHGEWKSVMGRRWTSPYRRNSAIAKAFEMCRKGTTLSGLRKFAVEQKVKPSWLVTHMLAEWNHGCTVVRNREAIKLVVPGDAKRDGHHSRATKPNTRKNEASGDSCKQSKSSQLRRRSAGVPETERRDQRQRCPDVKLYHGTARN